MWFRGHFSQGVLGLGFYGFLASVVLQSALFLYEAPSIKQPYMMTNIRLHGDWRMPDLLHRESFTTAQTSLGGFLKPTFCQSRLPKILPDCWDAGFLTQAWDWQPAIRRSLRQTSTFALDPVVVTTKVESCYASPSRSFQAMPCLLLAPPIHE